MTVTEGVDYAWDVPTPAALKAAGKHFACRYGGPGGSGKQLKAAELAALRAVGIDVVANAEGAAGGFRGRAAGISWARSALAYFNALGMPDGRPIYFSVDWGAGSGDWPDIDAALNGAASVIGADRVGVYGGYATIAHCVSAGTARWFWQTYAWSQGKWHPANHLEQYRNDVVIGAASLDLDRAMVADYGQWNYLEEDVLTDPDKAWIQQQITSITAFDKPQPDGTPTSKIGRLALTQGIPNGTKDGQPRDQAWQVLQDLGEELIAQSKALAALEAKIDAIATPDPAAMAAAIKQAVVQAVAQIAAAVQTPGA